MISIIKITQCHYRNEMCEAIVSLPLRCHVYSMANTNKHKECCIAKRENCMK